jgi:hypothetical protein
LLRKDVPANAVLIAPKVSDYRLNGEPGGTSGTYVDDGGTPLQFSATQVTDRTQAVSALNAPIDGCDKITVHADAVIPYVYAGCADAYTFVWINGNYRFKAQSTDPVFLVFFVNAYPY